MEIIDKVFFTDLIVVLLLLVAIKLTPDRFATAIVIEGILAIDGTVAAIVLLFARIWGA